MITSKPFKLLLIIGYLMMQHIHLSGQTVPTVYYRFDETNPLAPTVGATNLTGGGTYTIENGGQVGKYIRWTNNAANLMSGQNINTPTATVQMLFRKNYYMHQGRNVRLFVWGSMSVSLEYPKIIFNTHSTSSTILLEGINRKSWSYLFDEQWHHLAFVYDGSQHRLYLDGQLLHFAAVSGSGNINGTFMLNSTVDFDKTRSDLDEIALYSTALDHRQIYQNYLDAMAGNAYTTTLAPSAPATENLTGQLDTMEFTKNIPAWNQLQLYPLPRFKPGHTLLRNFNWMDPWFQGGALQPGITNLQAAGNGTTIQSELANNWHYYFNVDLWPSVYNTAFVNAANINPQWKIGLRVLRAQINGNNPLIKSQSLPNDHYLQNGSGQFLNENGSVTSSKIWRPTAPASSYTGDGNYIKSELSTLFNTLNRDIDWVNENGEVYPWITAAAMANDPVVNADRIASGLAPITYLSRKIALHDNQSYRDIIMSHPKLANAKWTYYQVDGEPLGRRDWSELRKLNFTINNQYYATGDFYVRWPSNWRYWQSAWHGWQWVVESRFKELQAGDRLFSPFVAAGWDVDESKNVRPAQWLGLLKAMNMLGSEFFYTGFFSLSAPWPDSKNWIWQAATPVYAQAVASRYEDLLKNGNLQDGDVPASYVTPAQPGYSYYTGDIRKLVVVRKHATLDRFAITGTFQNNSNLGGTVNSGTAIINLDGDSLVFTVRRQGSTYIYDKSGAQPVFYQLDSWHDSTHYSRWSHDFDLEAELYDNQPSGVSIKTDASWPDLTSFTSYLSFSGAQTVTYNIQPRQTGTYHLYVRARVVSDGDSSGFTVQLNSGSVKTINCISDTTWKWYRFNSSDGVAISFTDMAAISNTLRIGALNNKLLLDRIYLSSNAILFASSATSCATTPPPSPPVAVITPSGSTTFCTGGSVTLSASPVGTYLWNTGATTQNILVNSSGSYTVTVTTSAGSGTSTPVSVNVLPLPTGTVTTSGSTTLCEGSSVKLTASASSGYLWSTGQTGQTITVTEAGSYQVTVTGANGCTAAVTPLTTVTVINCDSVTTPTSLAVALARWYRTTITWDYLPNDATGFETELTHIGSGARSRHSLAGSDRTITYKWLRYKHQYNWRIRTVKNGVYSDWTQITFKIN